MALHSSRTTTGVLLATLATAGCSLGSSTLQDTRKLELAIEPGGQLAIDAGAGSLLLQGDARVSAIQITAEIYQANANDDYTLTLAREDGGGACLESHAGSEGFFRNDRIDLSIRVPESLQVRVNDGSGSINITGLTGNLDIEDGSGSIRIADIGANVTIDDGSGSIRVDNAGGTLRIDDGSGSITIRAAAGNVSIDDGSGSITVHDVAGIVTVTDGSGSITVKGAGDFELLDDGSGSVNVDGIRGRDSPRD